MVRHPRLWAEAVQGEGVMMILNLVGRSVLLMGAAAVAACAGDGSTGPLAPAPAVPSAFDAVSATDFTGVVATPAGVTPSVRAKGADGRPLKGVLVRFVVSQRGGTVANGTAVTDT